VEIHKALASIPPKARVMLAIENNLSEQKEVSLLIALFISGFF
jgi:hypothetical protein